MGNSSNMQKSFKFIFDGNNAYMKYFLYLMIFIIGFLTLYHSSVLTIDDAFISFRYSKRLAEGYGFSWNIHEAPIEGFSNLLWVIILAFFETIHANLPTIAFWLSGILLILTACLVFWSISKYSNMLFGFVCALAMFTSDAVLLSYLSGLETSLYAFLLAVSAVIYTYYRFSESTLLRILQIVVPCLLAITRFEGFALALIIVLSSVVISPKPFQRRYVVNFLIVLGFVIVSFALRYIIFQEYLPLPTQAKASGLSLIFDLKLIAFFKNVYPAGIDYLSGFLTSTITLYTLLPIGAIIFSVLISPGIKDNPVWIYAISLAFLIAVILLNGGDWMPGYRLVTPILGLILLSTPYTLKVFNNQNIIKNFYAVLSLMIFINAAYWISSSSVLRDAGFDKDLPHRWDGIGIYLDEITLPQDLILMEQIGRMGYYGIGLRIIDWQGLVNKTVAKEGNHPQAVGIYGKRMDEYNLKQYPEVLQTNNPNNAKNIVNFYLSIDLPYDYFLIAEPDWLTQKTYVFLREDIVEREDFRLPSKDARLMTLDEVEQTIDQYLSNS